MDPFCTQRRMAEEALIDVSVVDVYDQAAGIGKEFEKLIESYGVEAVTDLMPKVIRSLEHLEALAGRYEKENHEIHELRYAVQKLEAEKAEKAQERARYEEELEQIEENWQRESKELLNAVAKLQSENRRLKDSLSETKQAVVDEVAAASKKTEDEEIRVLTKLKETVDKQREDVRKYKREIAQKAVDCEALETQLERVVKVNGELRVKNSSQKKHSHTLMEEKVHLESQLVDKDQQITNLMKEEALVEATHNGSANGPAQLNEEEEVDGMPDEDLVTLEQKLSLAGKIVIDLTDPNRPRFTMNELRTVLMERNELKSKLIEVEDELATYKPKHKPTYTGDDDLPVQGPINREPDDKLYPGQRKESGIRKFFGSLFGSSTTLEKKPRRKNSSHVT